MTILAGILLFLAGVLTGIALFVLFFLWSIMTGQVI